MNDNKPLVAVITNNDDDIYCFRRELIEKLIDNGYKILISCPYGPKFNLMNDLEYIYDNPIIDRRGTNIYKDFKLFLHYKKLLKKFNPDVVLTYTAKPNVYAGFASKILNIPYINNVTGLGSVIKKGNITQQFILSLFKYAYKNANCVMFQNSSNMKLAINKKMVNKNYKLIPGSGVNTQKFSLQPYPEGGNGIKGNPIVFNYIGRILFDKGIDDYLKCAEIIKSKYPNTIFNVIGFIEDTENEYKLKLEDLEEKNIIKYWGEQKDVIPFIKSSHCIIHPSTYGEGMSNVLLENASCGRFIITTDNPGCYETVKDGISGFIYEGNNVNQLVEKVESFLNLENNVRKEMGFNGRKFIEEKFSRDIVINEYLDSIKRILLKKDGE